MSADASHHDREDREHLDNAARAGPTQSAHPSAAPCPHCGSPDTELVAMMQRHTCDADEWVRCNECGHVLTPPRWPFL
jgi:uncharacterized OB-fold protein